MKIYDQTSSSVSAFTDYYKFLCPNREEVYLFLEELYGAVADIPEVDGIHENHGLAPEELEAAIIKSMDNGAAGICLFTPGRMTDEDWVVLKNAIYNR